MPIGIMINNEFLTLLLRFLRYIDFKTIRFVEKTLNGSEKASFACQGFYFQKLSI